MSNVISEVFLDNTSNIDEVSCDQEVSEINSKGKDRVMLISSEKSSGSIRNSNTPNEMRGRLLELQNSPLLNCSSSPRCENCRELQQEYNCHKSKMETNLAILKEKIVTTDELIKNYQKKCQENAKLMKKVGDLSEKLKKCYGENGAIRIQLEKARQANEPLKKTARRFELEKTLAEEQVLDLNEKLKSAQSKLSELVSNTAAKDAKSSSLSKNVDQLVKENENLKEKLSKHQEKKDELKKELRNSKAATRRSEQRVKKFEKNYEELDEKFKVFKEKCQNSQKGQIEDSPKKKTRVKRTVRKHKNAKSQRPLVEKEPLKSNPLQTDIIVSDIDHQTFDQTSEEETDTEVANFLQKYSKVPFQNPLSPSPPLSPIPPSPAPPAWIEASANVLPVVPETPELNDGDVSPLNADIGEDYSWANLSDDSLESECPGVHDEDIDMPSPSSKIPTEFDVDSSSEEEQLQGDIFEPSDRHTDEIKLSKRSKSLDDLVRAVEVSSAHEKTALSDNEVNKKNKASLSNHEELFERQVPRKRVRDVDILEDRNAKKFHAVIECSFEASTRKTEVENSTKKRNFDETSTSQRSAGLETSTNKSIAGCDVSQNEPAIIEMPAREDAETKRIESTKKCEVESRLVSLVKTDATLDESLDVLPEDRHNNIHEINTEINSEETKVRNGKDDITGENLWFLNEDTKISDEWKDVEGNFLKDSDVCEDNAINEDDASNSTTLNTTTDGKQENSKCSVLIGVENNVALDCSNSNNGATGREDAEENKNLDLSSTEDNSITNAGLNEICSDEGSDSNVVKEIEDCRTSERLTIGRAPGISPNKRLGQNTVLGSKDLLELKNQESNCLFGLTAHKSQVSKTGVCLPVTTNSKSGISPSKNSGPNPTLGRIEIYETKRKESSCLLGLTAHSVKEPKSGLFRPFADKQPRLVTKSVINRISEKAPNPLMDELRSTRKAAADRRNRLRNSLLNDIKAQTGNSPSVNDECCTSKRVSTVVRPVKLADLKSPAKIKMNRDVGCDELSKSIGFGDNKTTESSSSSKDNCGFVTEAVCMTSKVISHIVSQNNKLTENDNKNDKIKVASLDNDIALPVEKSNCKAFVKANNVYDKTELSVNQSENNEEAKLFVSKDNSTFGYQNLALNNKHAPEIMLETSSGCIDNGTGASTYSGNGASISADNGKYIDLDNGASRDVDNQATIGVDNETFGDVAHALSKNVDNKASTDIVHGTTVDVDNGEFKGNENGASPDVDNGAALDVDDGSSKDVASGTSVDIDCRAFVGLDNQASIDVDNGAVKDNDNRASPEVNNRTDIDVDDGTSKHALNGASKDVDNVTFISVNTGVSREFDRRLLTYVENKAPKDVNNGAPIDVDNITSAETAFAKNAYSQKNCNIIPSSVIEEKEINSSRPDNDQTALKDMKSQGNALYDQETSQAINIVSTAEKLNEITNAISTTSDKLIPPSSVLTCNEFKNKVVERSSASYLGTNEQLMPGVCDKSIELETVGAETDGTLQTVQCNTRSGPTKSDNEKSEATDDKSCTVNNNSDLSLNSQGRTNEFDVYNPDKGNSKRPKHRELLVTNTAINDSKIKIVTAIIASEEVTSEPCLSEEQKDKETLAIKAFNTENYQEFPPAGVPENKRAGLISSESRAQRPSTENIIDLFSMRSLTVSPLPPSPPRQRVTPLLSPLPVTPQPEVLSPLCSSPEILSPPTLRDAPSDCFSDVVAPKPVAARPACTIKALDFSTNENKASFKRLPARSKSLDVLGSTTSSARDGDLDLTISKVLKLSKGFRRNIETTADIVSSKALQFGKGSFRRNSEKTSNAKLKKLKRNVENPEQDGGVKDGEREIFDDGSRSACKIVKKRMKLSNDSPKETENLTNMNATINNEGTAKNKDTKCPTTRSRDSILVKKSLEKPGNELKSLECGIPKKLSRSSQVHLKDGINDNCTLSDRNIGQSELEYLKHCFECLKNGANPSHVSSKVKVFKNLSSSTTFVSAIISYLKSNTENFLTDLLGKVKFVDDRLRAKDNSSSTKSSIDEDTRDEINRIVRECNLKPKLTAVEEKILFIVLEVAKAPHLSAVYKMLLQLIPKAILSQDPVTGNGLQSLCRFFAALCRYKNEINQVRGLIFDVAYNKILSVNIDSVLLSCFLVWPHIFHGNYLQGIRQIDKESTVGCTLSCTLQIIATCAAIKQGRSFYAKVLINIFGWSILKEDGLLLLSNVLLSMLEGEGQTNKGYECEREEHTTNFEILKSIEVLSVHMGWEWCNNYLIGERLWVIFRTWIKGIDRCSPNEQVPESTIIGAIKLIGLVCRIGIIEGHNFEYPDTFNMFLKAFVGILKKSQVDANISLSVQLAAVYTLLNLSPTNPKMVSTMLNDWLKGKGNDEVPRDLRLAVESAAWEELVD